MRGCETVVGLLAVGACGRLGFDDRIDALAPDAGRDCVPLWLAGTMTIAPPVNLAGVNSAAADRNPFVTDDGQLLYFVSDRGGNNDVYVATRDGGGFGGATPVPDLSSTSSDGRVTITSDGLTAIASTARPGAGVAGMNLWLATRAQASDPFADFTVAPFVNVNSALDEYEPFISRDLLRVYWTRSVDVMIASRATPADAFGTPALIAELDSPSSDCCPGLSADERVVVMALARSGAVDMFYATRASQTEPFSAAQPLPINDPIEEDVHTFLTPDACTIYFISRRTGGMGDYDIWVADVLAL